MDVAPAIERAVREADANIPVAKIMTRQEVIDHTVAGPAFFAWVAGGFAGFAFLLTMAGLFVLRATSAMRRMRSG